MATGAAFGGSTLAEAYTMRKLHQEKMKKLEAAQKGMVANEKEEDKSANCNTGSGCFFGVFKKGHSAKISSLDHQEKQPYM
ncbi:hypothetical protein JCGZ_12008 [Jatropha curcas]|uniref:Uncharacterized protein n=1 Tax=Jatropha curcas TaxID=180498 RepID=A0A067K937_JATCU|nr:hypothetical protein JCGZ_12008 [Jatropha curcas]